MVFSIEEKLVKSIQMVKFNIVT